MKPSQLLLPVFYPNGNPSDGAGMSQTDYDNGEVGTDDLRTIVELLAMTTFSYLEPEFQRRYVAMCWACYVETGKWAGVGTGWRSEATQAANHARDPKQFAPVSASLHMRKPPRNVAYAIDTVPYDVLGWLHANCERFGINYLDHIPNERHHCQSIELPNSGSAYNTNPTHYSAAAAMRRDLPYLGTRTLTAWLTEDKAIESVRGPWGQSEPPVTPTPPVVVPTPKPPTVTPTTGDHAMHLLAKQANSDTFWFSSDGGKTRSNVRSLEHIRALLSAGVVDVIWGTRFNDTNWTGASVLSVADLDKYLGRVA